MSESADTKAFDADNQGTEQRRFHRAIMQISSCLILDGLKVDCVVQDLSLVGARVEVDSDQLSSHDKTIGFNFQECSELEIGASVNLPIAVVWANGCVAGIRFLCGPYDIAEHLEHLLPKECFNFLFDNRFKPQNDAE